MLQTCSGWSSCAVFVSLFLRPSVSLSRSLDSSGHRAGCASVGVMGTQGFAIESAAARVCQEGGARVATVVLLRDLVLVVSVARSGRRLEITADGLPLFGGVQRVVDAALVSPLHLNKNHAARGHSGHHCDQSVSRASGCTANDELREVFRTLFCRLFCRTHP